MSGLGLAGGPSASAGNGRPGRIQVPGPTGSPIRGPRDIMREREARERRKAEDAAKEEMIKANAEEEARAREDEKRRSAERRAVAAGAAAQQRAGEAAQRVSGGSAGQRVSDKSQRQDQQRVASGERQQDSLQGVGRGGRALGGDEPAPKSRPIQSQPQRTNLPESSRARPSQPGPSAAGPSAEAPQQASGSTVPARSSFPHAFERWETLSAHWEGLTSFWIRRLEENSNEVNREPISQQLSRQVTDLSAAGANLFHAVVELQRLRASSERKFQRWFFETRAEQERAQEIQAMTENTLEAERRERAQAIAEAVENERKRSTADKQLAEMKRELQISKDEARRAWEELGRREQEERDRTIALREGHPVTIGGVQVVPMMQGVPSRHGSARTGAQHVPEPEGPVDDSDEAYQQYQHAQRAEALDPFIEQHQTPTRSTSRPTAPASYTDYTQAPAVQPTSPTSGAYYQPHDDNTLHPIDPTARSEGNQSRPSFGGSEGAMSEDEEYEIDAEDEYDAATARAREQAYFEQYGQAAPIPEVEYGRGPTGTSGSTGRVAEPTSHPSTNSSEPADYSGGGYGSGPGWEAVPRHHHPTRLSDVLEEDERSRTSASQVSGRHGGRE